YDCNCPTAACEGGGMGGPVNAFGKAGHHREVTFDQAPCNLRRALPALFTRLATAGHSDRAGLRELPGASVVEHLDRVTSIPELYGIVPGMIDPNPELMDAGRLQLRQNLVGRRQSDGGRDQIRRHRRRVTSETFGQALEGRTLLKPQRLIGAQL